MSKAVQNLQRLHFCMAPIRSRIGGKHDGKTSFIQHRNGAGYLR